MFKRKRARRAGCKRYAGGILFLLPDLCGVVLFTLLPFAGALCRSFQNSFTHQFTALANYRSVLANAAFHLAVKNTARFMLLCIPLLVGASLVLAVLLSSVRLFSGWIKCALLLPMAVPTASVVLIWRILFSAKGLVNAALFRLGIRGCDWMREDSAFYVLVGSYLWRNIGYDMVLWLCGLQAIPQSIYEAARVDGAGRMRCFFSMTLPNLGRSFFLITVLSILNAFKVFREAYLVAGDYPHESMYLLQHLYNNWFRDMSFDRVAAAAVMQGAVVLLLCLLLSNVREERG